MEQQQLEVRKRAATGKGTARKLRARGYIPAVCYRKGLDPILLSLEKRELERVLHASRGQNILIQLKIQDAGVPEDQETVILKEVQRDAFHRVMHADFMGVLMDQLITVEVPIRLVGEPTAALREGGMIQQLRRTVEVECLPADIPEQVDADIANLNMGDSVHVVDLKVPDGSRILTDGKESVVVLSAPEEEKPEAAQVTEEAAEGEEQKGKEEND